MYTIEQVMAALEKHEAIEGYDGIEECFCGAYRSFAPYAPGKTFDQYDRHVREAVKAELEVGE